LTPSVFVRSEIKGQISTVDVLPSIIHDPSPIFKCPECGGAPLEERSEFLECPDCKRKWGVKDGIYDFRVPIENQRII